MEQNLRETKENIDYGEIKKRFDLEDEKEIIWLKFSDDGYLALVAQSNDINFDIPASEDDYGKRGEGCIRHQAF